MSDPNTNVVLVDFHHDGLGLNDRITIEADLPDPNAGAASHHYRVYIDLSDTPEAALHADPKRVLVGEIQFQHGPRFEPGSKGGITEAVLYAILRHRLGGFQSGPFSCRENAIQLTKIEEAHHWSEARARSRAKRGVLGKNLK